MTPIVNQADGSGCLYLAQIWNWEFGSPICVVVIGSSLHGAVRAHADVAERAPEGAHAHEAGGRLPCRLARADVALESRPRLCP